MKERGVEVQLQFLRSGHACGTLFQLACLLSEGRVSVMKEKQGHTVLRVISAEKLAHRLAQQQVLVGVDPEQHVAMSLFMSGSDACFCISGAIKVVKNDQSLG